jgi:serine/threonine-protein kinase
VELRTLGRYKIVGELGRGAMGAVYRAQDPMIDREVAIKTLLPNLPKELMGEVRERFIREARSAGRLNHPNIVTIYDVGEQDGMAYMAMELLQGHSLQQILRHPQRLAFKTVARIIAQVADGLDHAHRSQVVHRDVKPANIMIDNTGHAKLTDFGVAYVPSSTMTQTGTALGSPRYMSPEQVLGQPIDGRSDIFSLGVVLYEALTRRTPFEQPQDTTVFALMNRIASAPHTPLRRIDPQIPEAFERIVGRALAKPPAERYQNAGEMAAELRKIAGEPSADATPRPAAYENAAAQGAQSGVRPPHDEALRTQLITDLDKFVEKYDREEQARLRAEEEARLRKEDEVRRWGEAEARKRDDFERSREAPVAAPADDPGATKRRAALELLRKQAASQAPRENPEVVRAKAIGALDASMRTAFQYLAELAHELNSVNPTSGQPYEFIYLGKLPSVSLSQAFVDSRPRRIDGKDVCDHVFIRYRITPARPAKANLLGDDIRRCQDYLGFMKVAFQQRVEAKNDFGKVTRAEFTVTGSLPCEVNVRADYNALAVNVELTNVRRLGRVAYRLTPQQFDDAVDDLARYMLGADDDFEKIARK